jgi:hypothetical protein
MPEKTIKLLQIPAPGNNSVKGSIIEQYSVNVYDNLDEFCWLIACPFKDNEFVKSECIQMKMEEFIIIDRASTIFNF